MPNLFVFISLLVLFFSQASLSQEADSAFSPRIDFNFFLGQKDLDSDWSPLDSQSELGFQLNVENKTLGLDTVLALLFSSDDGTVAGLDTELSTHEIRLGLMKKFSGAHSIQPFMAGGAVLIDLQVDISNGISSGSVDDSAVGYWFQFGFLKTFKNSFNAGLEVSISDADVEFGGQDFDAGGQHIGLLVGYRF